MTEFETFRREVSVTLDEGDGRTLVARLVPYNEVATVSDGMGPYKERFIPGAFNAQLRAPSRIKAFLNFRHRQGIADQIGHATEIDDQPDGLHGKLRVLNTPGGDTALELYRAGELTKLSIEFENRKSRKVGGVIERVSARLLGVALVPEGAYAGAEVIAVREQPEVPEVEPLKEFDPVLARRMAALGLDVPAELLPVEEVDEQEAEDAA